jgi:hypothetical protein
MDTDLSGNRIIKPIFTCKGNCDKCADKKCFMI